MSNSTTNFLERSHNPEVTETTSYKTPHVPSARTNVFARLQALFPSTDSSTPSGRRDSLPPKFLKVRIATWNMHESLPKGDLVELLGDVSPINPATEQPQLTSIPPLSADGDHPYHLVVVAGQECPSQLGIPLGLGAGFKLKDKDNDKVFEKEKEVLPDLEAAPSSSSYGWTAILEDWYCHGRHTQVTDKKRGFRKISSIPDSLVSASDSKVNLKRRSAAKSLPECKGPYEILIKERMMGLYLAIYIHRDIKHLIRGTSKSAVTAGLIGGRVGNKGGVGISVNLDGTTLLFINAHLAAHEGKVLHRLRNMQKIKTTLSVDDWLDKDDHRMMAEDLTDRFDYSFIFGDLNFRLDISRLHADWLISRKDYAHALAFDQLRNLMLDGEAFVGFEEAPINFPPTFKYDVLRTVKQHKTKSSRSGNHIRDNHLAEMPLVEVQEKDREVDEEDGDGDEGDGEAASTASSVFTSVHSKITTDQELDDDYLMRPKASRASTGNLVGKPWGSAAAHKAKAKWVALLSSGTPGRLLSPSSPVRWSRSKRSSLVGTPNSLYVPRTAPSTPTVNLDVVSTTFSFSSQSADLSTLGPSLSRMDPSNIGNNFAEVEQEINEQDRGVYDTSSKKRVPSWCDRILWKTTIKQDESEGETTDHLALRPRTRVSQFFANAFRPGARKGSHSSYVSIEVQQTAPPRTEELPTPSSSFNGVESPSPLETSPFSRFAQSPSRAQQRPNSIDGLPRPTKALGRSATESKPRRRASTDLPLPRSKTIPAALESTRIVSISPLPTESTDAPPSVPPKEVHHMPSRWKFLQFFHRNASQSTIAHDRPPTPELASPLPQRPKKGDVICLSYNSLDDRGMRRLEGRSDHRPVIGSYAMYI